MIAAPGATHGQDVMRGHGGPVRALVVQDVPRELISGSFDTSLIRWDLDRGAAKQVLRYHEGAVNALVGMDDGCLASGGEDRRIAVWCGSADVPVLSLEGHDAPVTALAAWRRGRNVGGSVGGSVGVEFGSGLELVSASFDGTVRRWRLPAAVLGAIADRSMAEAGVAGRERVASQTVASQIITRHDGPVTAIAAAPDHSFIVSAGFDGVIRFSRTSPEAHDSIGQAQASSSLTLLSPIIALAVAPDSEVVAASTDGRLRFITPPAVAGAPATVVAELELAESAIDAMPLSSLALSPDGRLVAAAGLKGSIAVITRSSRTIASRLTGPGLPVWSLAFDIDNRTLLTGGADRVIRRWDAVAAKPLSPTVPEPAAATTPTERGAIVFRACQACHTLTVDEGPRAGPSLAGVFGRRIATAPGFNFSAALQKLDIVWSAETISRLFEVGPAAYTPGTKMPEQTLSDPADRKALVDWLERMTSSNGKLQ